MSRRALIDEERIRITKNELVRLTDKPSESAAGFWLTVYAVVIILAAFIGAIVIAQSTGVEFPHRSATGTWVVYWIVLAVLVSMYAFVVVSFMTTRMVLTTRRALVYSGWIGSYDAGMQLHKIETIYAGQGWFGKMLGYGYMVVGGTGGDKLYFKHVVDHRGFARKLEALVRLYQKERYARK